jgi:hypothetical protein
MHQITLHSACATPQALKKGRRRPTIPDGAAFLLAENPNQPGKLLPWVVSPPPVSISCEPQAQLQHQFRRHLYQLE